MNEETFNLSIRKFLKMVGINSQREIEQAVARAIADGSIAGRESFPALRVAGGGGLEDRRQSSTAKSDSNSSALRATGPTLAVSDLRYREISPALAGGRRAVPDPLRGRVRVPTCSARASSASSAADFGAASRAALSTLPDFTNAASAASNSRAAL